MKMRAAIASLLFVASMAPTLAASDWNGTWAGNWKDGDGVQIVMAGNDVTGMFWHGDYLSGDLHSAVSSDGKTLAITWDHASAVLTRVDAQTAHVVIHEPKQPDAAFDVKRDH
jgi:hypothetical protein